MIIERIINEPISSNCYILYKEGVKSCLIIDPGSKENQRLQLFLKEKKLVPEYVVLTHEHFDHVGGVLSLQKDYSFKLVCSNACGEAISDSKKNLSLFHDGVGFIIDIPFISIDEINYKLDCLGELIEFYPTMGHTPGSISILVKNQLFCGDLMIQGERTITKLPGGSKKLVKDSIDWIVSSLGLEILIYSGHGDPFILKDYSHLNLYKSIN